MLHGRGADEHDLLDIAKRLGQNFACASPRAPIALEGGGYTWFESRGVARPVAASLNESVVAMRAWLDTVAGEYGRCYLFGFSAGMMMAGALLLDDPGRFAGAVLLSGALALDCATVATAGRLAGLPVFLGWGTLDDVIPPALFAQTATYLRERSGAELTVREYRHAHAISSRELGDVAAWFQQL